MRGLKKSYMCVRRKYSGMHVPDFAPSPSIFAPPGIFCQGYRLPQSFLCWHHLSRVVGYIFQVLRQDSPVFFYEAFVASVYFYEAFVALLLFLQSPLSWIQFDGGSRMSPANII